MVDNVSKLVQRVDHPLHQRTLMGPAESSDMFKDDNRRPSTAHEFQDRNDEVSSTSDVSPTLLQAERRERLAWKAGSQDVAVGASRRIGQAKGRVWMIRSQKNQGDFVDLPTNLRVQAMTASHSKSRHVESSKIADKPKARGRGKIAVRLRVACHRARR